MKLALLASLIGAASAFAPASTGGMSGKFSVMDWMEKSLERPRRRSGYRFNSLSSTIVALGNGL